MPLSAGARLGTYEIVAPLGAGGMGEVWRAHDSKLGRDVAIKVLPPALAGDAQYMARFEREAQTLASLNHPNIATVYGIEQGALVMELVEGPTLADRIAEGTIPIDEALPLIRQIADGLEAAHERGVIHRDLKPANIKITPSGSVKLLDFGLAKTAEARTAAADTSPTMSPTLSLAMTQAGMILGTAGYMSPEQARGQAVDRRADIWAFGVVVYEMLTGEALFHGETASDTLAAVLRADIDMNKLPASMPPALRRIVRRSLERDRKRRLPDIAMVRLELDEPEAAAPAPSTAPPARRSRMPWAMSAAWALTAAAGWWGATRPAAPRPLIRLNAELSPDAQLANAPGGMMALSPDGRRLAVTLRGADGKTRLYTRLLDQAQFTVLTGTDDAAEPFFSPDSQWLGFVSGAKLKKVSVQGGAPIALCDVNTPRGASWGEDGNIVIALATTGGLSRVSSAGGTPEPLTTLSTGERTHRWPQVLAGGQAVIFTAHTGANDYNDGHVDVFSLKTHERKPVQRGGFYGRYLTTPNGSGRLLYMHQGTIFAAPFDLGRLTETATPVPVLESVSNNGNRGADFAFSDTGTFVYLAGSTQTGWEIAWVDQDGKKQPIHTAPGGYATPRLSPDGKRLAFAASTGSGSDIWVQDLDRDTPSRLTFAPGFNNWPIWTPDGKSIVFRSTAPGKAGLYWLRADGAGEAQRMTDGTMDETPYSISPDGKRLAFQRAGNSGSADIYTAAIEGDTAHPRLGQPELFLGTPYTEVLPAFSPDGRWLAYMSIESGTAEIYVRPFPGPGGRWQISSGGGSFPLWSRDGKELLYRANDLRIMAVSYTAKGESFSAGRPHVWSEIPVVALGTLSTFDLAPDGKRLAAFISDQNEKQSPLTHLTFLLNFTDSLR